jgi:hypothetical protein
MRAVDGATPRPNTPAYLRVRIADPTWYPPEDNLEADPETLVVTLERLTPSRRVQVLNQCADLFGEEDEARLVELARSESRTGEDNAELARLTASHEAAKGWLLLMMWDEPSIIMETQEAYNAAQDASMDAPYRYGSMAFAELFRWGLLQEEIDALYLFALSSGRPKRARKPVPASEVLTFSPAPPQPVGTR